MTQAVQNLEKGAYDGASAVVAIYGPSGLGKTTDMLYSFPRGLFIAPPGAIKPAYNVVGHVPEVAEAATIMEATELVKKHGKSNRFDAIIVDDFSLLAESTVSFLERKYDGFKLWGAIRNEVLEFRNVARHAGMHVVLTAHESSPRTVSGSFIRGGPRLPGRLPEDVPTVCDLVLRAAPDQTRKGWHACYRCTIDDPNWVTKDRHGVTPDKAPMNVGEILRLAGYSLRRAEGLEWQDDFVQELTEALLAADPKQASSILSGAAAALQEAGHHAYHVRWAIRDAVDRVSLMRARSNPFAMYF